MFLKWKFLGRDLSDFLDALAGTAVDWVNNPDTPYAYPPTITNVINFIAGRPLVA